jgi:Zn-dependent protease with chaperone function
MFLFLLLYFTLIFIGVGVLGTYAYLTYYLATIPTNVFAVLGAMISATMAIIHLIFLFEFIFLSQKTPTNKFIPIHKSKEEGLFKLIHTQAKSLKAPPPVQIYLSPELEFGSFYKYPRLSATLPVKKRLHLGCALFNILTEDELKAIITHEFAHHSNIYLRLASTLTLITDYYYNILYSNKLIDSLINKWHNVSPVFVIFVYPSSWFVRLAQNTLRFAYQLAIQNILAIRRQNDYYADEIAVAHYGKEALQSALLKIEVAKCSFEEFKQFKERRKLNVIDNFYEALHEANIIFANYNSIELKNQIISPRITDYYYLTKSRVREITEWDEIPSVTNRIKRIDHNKPYNTRNITPKEKYKLNNLKSYQERFTKLNLNPNNKSQRKRTEIIDLYKKHFDSISFDPIFNEYFRYRTPGRIVDSSIDPTNLNPSIIFHSSVKRKAYRLILMQNDITALNNIMLRQNPNLEFTFKDIHKDMSEIHELIKILEDECKVLQLELNQTDKEINSFLNYIEKINGKNLIDHFYNKVKYYQLQIEKHSPLVNKIERKLSFLHEKTGAQEIIQNFSIVKQYETVFKTNIKSMLNDELYVSILSESETNDLETYSNHTLLYFDGDEFNKQSLDLLFNVFEIYKNTLKTGNLISKKRMSEYFIYLYNNSNLSHDIPMTGNHRLFKASKRINIK